MKYSYKLSGMNITGLKPGVLSIMVLSLAACSLGASYQAQVTSMNVDCNADTVKVSHSRYYLNDTETWTAECNGKIYDCNYDPDGELSNCFLREE
jgi:hypothetical protein